MAALLLILVCISEPKIINLFTNVMHMHFLQFLLTQHAMFITFTVINGTVHIIDIIVYLFGIYSVYSVYVTTVIYLSLNK